MWFLFHRSTFDTLRVLSVYIYELFWGSPCTLTYITTDTCVATFPHVTTPPYVTMRSYVTTPPHVNTLPYVTMRPYVTTPPYVTPPPYVTTPPSVTMRPYVTTPPFTPPPYVTTPPSVTMRPYVTALGPFIFAASNTISEAGPRCTGRQSMAGRASRLRFLIESIMSEY